MTVGKLTRYIASAGSGKTHKLTGEYLNLIFENRLNYRKILAVTFTNKAAAEMKGRILENLYLLANGRESDYIEGLCESLGWDESRLREEASVLLNIILSDYSWFSVGTIDSFFQKVLRSFAYEAGLKAGFNLVIDDANILTEAYDLMMSDLEDDTQLLSWLIEFTRYEMEENDAWNTGRKVLGLGKEIFKERFRLLNKEGLIKTDRVEIMNIIKQMRAIATGFRSSISSMAGECLDVIDLYSIDEQDLKGSGSGILPAFESIKMAPPGKIGSYLRKAVEEDEWTRKGEMSEKVKEALENGLREKACSLVNYYDETIIHYNTALEILRNSFTMGILTDLAVKIRSLVTGTGRFLLSDAGEVINRIIAKDQTPFIYEKVGNRFDHFMIDEFQDTSRIQWNNFRPLIDDSLDQGLSSFVVGDSKQSIYRWRNSDWSIFSGLPEMFRDDQFISKTLPLNYRSHTRIIEFNNWLFSILPGMAMSETAIDTGDLSDLYNEVVQSDPGNKPGGFIRIGSVNCTDDIVQTDRILEKLGPLVEELQDRGVRPEEIGILVKSHSEGNRIIEELMRWSAQAPPDKVSRYSYQVISQDSLYLSSSPAVNLIISLFRYLVNRSDRLMLANVVHSFLLASSRENEKSRPDLSITEREMIGFLPDGFAEFTGRIRTLGISEATDEIIKFFRLGEYPANIPFITIFQDLTLEFSGSETNDLMSFISWWDTDGYRRSVTSSDQPGAMRLMTIHKSKGLQFRFVIIPFISWTLSSTARDDVIWVQTGQEPFSEAGAIPVMPRKMLLETFFSDDYSKEIEYQLIDSLNLLYVAFTRAVEGLIAYVPVPKRNFGKPVGKLLMSLLDSDDRPGWINTVEKDQKTGDVLFEAGELASGGKASEDSIEDSTIDLQYLTGSDNSRFILKLRGIAISDDARKERDDRIKYGLLMHEIFARIVTVNDVEKAVAEASVQGLIPSTEAKALAADIRKMITDGEQSRWFDGKHKVKNESPLLIGGGTTRRPDRVVFFSDRTEVIDFKFGNENRSHYLQVEEYMKLLQEMGYNNVKGYLWYIGLNLIKKVG